MSLVFGLLQPPPSPAWKQSLAVKAVAGVCSPLSREGLPFLFEPFGSSVMLERVQETAGRTGTLHPLPGMHRALHGTLSLKGDPVRARGAGDRGP